MTNRSSSVTAFESLAAWGGRASAQDPRTRRSSTQCSRCAATHRKKRFTSFPSPARMSLTKLPLGRNKFSQATCPGHSPAKYQPSHRQIVRPGTQDSSPTGVGLQPRNNNFQLRGVVESTTAFLLLRATQPASSRRFLRQPGRRRQDIVVNRAAATGYYTFPKIKSLL
jgi:hypothetical protein